MSNTLAFAAASICSASARTKDVVALPPYEILPCIIMAKPQDLHGAAFGVQQPVLPYSQAAVVG